MPIRSHDAFDPCAEPPPRDGFKVLDACHQRTLVLLDTLARLVARLDHSGLDQQAQAMAGEIVQFFSTTVRRHHEDEERHVFPRLVESAEPHVVNTVLKLQQDHDWLEEEWMALSPQLEAMAAGRPWFDLEALRQGSEAFIALSRDHIALEESCIYPEVRERVPAAERREIGREMAARRRAQRERRSA
jgi:hemerythrin-like domain-containing protein